MGRIPTKNLNLPSRMRARPKSAGKIWYYYDVGGKPRKEIPLGSDYVKAVQKWAELEAVKIDKVGQFITFKDVADRYTKEIIPNKAPRTQRDNIKELNWLLKFFNDPPAPIDSIRPINIREYLTWRGNSAKVRANREKALFSHIWNMAREWNITEKSNPCAGIKGFTEEGRDIYIEDDVLAAVWNSGDIPLREALDMAYLVGQRPADTIKMSITDIKSGVLSVAQNKTKQKLRFNIEGELSQLLEQILERKKLGKIHSLALICNESGRALTACALRYRFEKARKAAAIAKPDLKDEIFNFQFRDLRAKAGTDKADSSGMRGAQMQLGHASMKMTESYVRKRRGEKVSPTK